MELNVKIKVAARLMQKPEQFIRIGLQRGFLHFGTAIKTTSNRYAYHISAAKFCDYMGITPEQLVAEMHSTTVEKISELGILP